jgi:uncharacterized membrane protein YfcA
VMLAVVGGYMFQESLRSLRGGIQQQLPEGQGKASWFTRLNQALPFRTEFEKSGISMSPIMPLSFGVLVGVLAAIMGVGGGFIMVPVMVYMLRMPMHVVVGTSLFQILFTCINVTFMQAYVNHTVDFMLALLLLLGSTTGAQIGARVSRKLKADQLKILLASIVLVVMLKMLLELLLRPGILLGLRGGH